MTTICTLLLLVVTLSFTHAAYLDHIYIDGFTQVGNVFSSDAPTTSVLLNIVFGSDVVESRVGAEITRCTSSDCTETINTQPICHPVTNPCTTNNFTVGLIDYASFASPVYYYIDWYDKDTFEQLDSYIFIIMKGIASSSPPTTTIAPTTTTTTAPMIQTSLPSTTTMMMMPVITTTPIVNTTTPSNITTIAIDDSENSWTLREIVVISLLIGLLLLAFVAFVFWYYCNKTSDYSQVEENRFIYN